MPLRYAEGPRIAFGKGMLNNNGIDKWMIQGRRNLVPCLSQMKTVLLC